jgi:hypothetical protein
MEQEMRFICVYLCSSVEKICPDLFCTDLVFRLIKWPDHPAAQRP